MPALQGCSSFKMCLEKTRIPEVSENFLSRIWAEQRFLPDSLHTTDGHDVQVIRRGRRNSDNGPDFRNALIRIRDDVHEGDVELHLEIADWYGHGHDTDPAYNETILHGVLWPPSSAQQKHSGRPIRKANGESVPTVIVESCLSAPLEKLQTAFQRADARKQEKITRCQNALKHLPPEQILSQLHRLGLERLDERTRYFASLERLERGHPARNVTCGQDVRAPNAPNEQLLYEALCEGLGYSSNKRPFLELARRLPLERIMSHLPKQQEHEKTSTLSWIQAMLFGTAGLLPQTALPSAPDTQGYVRELRTLWEMLAPCLDVKPMKPEHWHFFRLRPPNFPTRRLAALSYLIMNYAEQGFFEKYLSLFQLLADHPERLKQGIPLLERTLRIPAQGYWKGRYLLGNAVFPEHDKQFLGQSRIRDILISAIFPVFLLYAQQTTQPELKTFIVQLCEIFPSPSPNRITRTVTEQVFPRQEPLPPRIKTALVYQGMLHLYRHYCYLPACGLCPFNRSLKPTF